MQACGSKGFPSCATKVYSTGLSHCLESRGGQLSGEGEIGVRVMLRGDLREEGDVTHPETRKCPPKSVVYACFSMNNAN